jgi:AraC-like DNA-binding protein
VTGTMRATHLSTAAVGAGAEFDYWADAVSATFVPLECSLGQDGFGTAFHADLVNVRVGEVQFTRITAAAHRVLRTRRMIARSDVGQYKIGLQLDGVGWISQGGRDAVLRPGDLTVYDTSRPYTLAFDGDTTTFVFMVPDHVLGLSRDAMERITATAISGRDGLGSVVSPFLARIADLTSSGEPAITARLAGNVTDLLGTLFRERLELGQGEPDGVRGARLLAVQAWIERNLSRPELSPETVAAANHISVRYLYRLFETEGTTVARWIKERRLEGCRRELADPSLARYGVSAIGARWGLLDPASFSRAFRAAYGVSPREYRASRTAVGTR